MRAAAPRLSERQKRLMQSAAMKKQVPAAPCRSEAESCPCTPRRQTHPPPVCPVANPVRRTKTGGQTAVETDARAASVRNRTDTEIGQSDGCVSGEPPLRPPRIIDSTHDSLSVSHPSVDCAGGITESDHAHSGSSSSRGETGRGLGASDSQARWAVEPFTHCTIAEAIGTPGSLFLHLSSPDEFDAPRDHQFQIGAGEIADSPQKLQLLAPAFKQAYLTCGSAARARM